MKQATDNNNQKKMMTTEIKDQSKRSAAIALLEQTIAKYAAAIAITELTLSAQIQKQINRLAELRHQKMLLAWHQAAARKAAASQPATNPTIQ